MINAMTDLAIQRVENRTITITDSVSLPPSDDYVYLGGGTWYARNSRRAEIVHSSVVRPFEVPQTRGQVARDYLKVKYGKKLPLRARGAQIRSWGDAMSAALYAKSGWTENMVYADIKSAYWSILSIVGYDVEWWPERFLGVASSVADFPLWEDKTARSAITATGIMNTSDIYNYGKFERVAQKNVYQNLSLWNLTHTILHMCAGWARSLGGVYFNTDGAIIPRRALDDYTALLAGVGLRCGVKGEGVCHVRGAGAYKIGHLKSGHYARVTDHDHDNLVSVNAAWYQARLLKLSRVADRLAGELANE